MEDDAPIATQTSMDPDSCQLGDDKDAAQEARSNSAGPNPYENQGDQSATEALLPLHEGDSAPSRHKQDAVTPRESIDDGTTALQN